MSDMELELANISLRKDIEIDTLKIEINNIKMQMNKSKNYSNKHLITENKKPIENNQKLTTELQDKIIEMNDLKIVHVKKIEELKQMNNYSNDINNVLYNKIEKICDQAKAEGKVIIKKRYQFQLLQML